MKIYFSLYFLQWLYMSFLYKVAKPLASLFFRCYISKVAASNKVHFWLHKNVKVYNIEFLLLELYHAKRHRQPKAEKIYDRLSLYKKTAYFKNRSKYYNITWQ